MKKFLLILPLLVLGGCDGYYRYPCQDPANWGKLECNNDVCQAEGTCTSIVLARSGTLLDNAMSGQQNFSTDEESGINNTECTPAEQPATLVSYTGKGDTPRNFGVKNYMIQRPATTDQDVAPEVIEQVDSAADSAEQPLTMNTVVDTAAHNAATR